MADVVAPDLRLKAIGKALADDVTLQGLTTTPYVLAEYPVGKPVEPLKLVTVRLEDGPSQSGWRGRVIDRYALDVWVDEEADADPLTEAAKIAAAVDGALTATKLKAALVALSVTTATASARRVAGWSNVPEETDQAHTVHLTASYEIEFVKLD